MQARCEQIGLAVLTIGHTDTCARQDPSGAWARWFDTHGIRAVLVRPDHYIFGALADETALPGLVNQFADRLQLATPAPAHPAHTPTTTTTG